MKLFKLTLATLFTIGINDLSSIPFGIFTKTALAKTQSEIATKARQIDLVNPGLKIPQLRQTPVSQLRDSQADSTAQLVAQITLPEITIVAIPPASLRSEIGTLNYYRKRNDDFVSRADPGETPPDYYLSYGEKYVNRFRTVLRPNLSPSGQAWLDCSLRALQTAIEDRRDANPWEFAELERDNARFRDFAYATHSNAYVSCGVCQLSIVDQVKIAATPDFRDLLSLGGVGQIIDTFLQCQPSWFYPQGPAL